MTYHTVVLSPPFLQGNSHCYPCFQPKLQTSTGGEAEAPCLHCAEPGLRGPAEVCGVHPGQDKTLLGQLRGSRVIIHPCCDASTGPHFWAREEQRQHRALQASPAHILQCFTFPIPPVSALDICVSSQSQGTLALVTSTRGLKPPAGPVHASAAALLYQGSTGAIQDCHCFKSKPAEKQVAFKNHFVCKP